MEFLFLTNPTSEKHSVSFHVACLELCFTREYIRVPVHGDICFIIGQGCESLFRGYFEFADFDTVGKT